MSLPRVRSPRRGASLLAGLCPSLSSRRRRSSCSLAFDFRFPLLLSGGGLFGAPAEAAAVDPDPMQDHGQLAGERDAGLLATEVADQVRRPGLGALTSAGPGSRGCWPPRRACAGRARRAAWRSAPTTPLCPTDGAATADLRALGGLPNPRLQIPALLGQLLARQKQCAQGPRLRSLGRHLAVPAGPRKLRQAFGVVGIGLVQTVRQGRLGPARIHDHRRHPPPRDHAAASSTGRRSPEPPPLQTAQTAPAPPPEGPAASPRGRARVLCHSRPRHSNESL